MVHCCLLQVVTFSLCKYISSPGYIIYNISWSRQFVDLEEVSLETSQLWGTQGQRSIYDTCKDIAGQSQDDSFWEREASCNGVARYSPGTQGMVGNSIFSFFTFNGFVHFTILCLKMLKVSVIKGMRAFLRLLPAFGFSFLLHCGCKEKKPIFSKLW